MQEMLGSKGWAIINLNCWIIDWPVIGEDEHQNLEDEPGNERTFLFCFNEQWLDIYILRLYMSQVLYINT